MTQERDQPRETDRLGPVKKPAASPELESRLEEPLGTLTSAVGDTSLAGASYPRGNGPGSGAPPVPVEFGRYRILRELGAGAMGTVYLAEDSQLHRQVALKVPQLDQRDSSRLDRFFREARVAATLNHPNICPIYDIGVHEGTHFISMAFIQGRPLSAFLKGGKPIADRTAASLVRKLALALQEAHAHGVIHRDLKPANVMIDRRGEPIVMDFGLARQANGNDEAQITQSGAILGTPAYMSPEQVRGETAIVGAASDQYALGVILYQMLSGRLPFEGAIVSVLTQIATQNPMPLSAHRAGIATELEQICLKAMARDPQNRFANTAELAQSLAQFLRQTVGTESNASIAAVKGGNAAESAAETKQPDSVVNRSAVVPAPAEGPDGGPSTPARVVIPPRLPVPWFAGLAGLAVLFLVALGFFLLSGNRSQPEPAHPVDGGMNLANTITSGASSDASGASNGSADSSGAALPPEGAPEPEGTDGEQSANGLLAENAEEPPDWGSLLGIADGQAPDGQMPAEESSEAEPDNGEAEKPLANGEGENPETERASDEPEPTTEEGEVAQDDPNPKKRKTGQRAVVDPFPVGSIWKGKTRQWTRGEKTPKDIENTLQVIERGKGTFLIRYWSPGGPLVVEVSGRISKNQIEWNTENAKVTNGTIGRHRFQGKISNGNRLELKFIGQSISGQATGGVTSLHKQD